MAYGYIQVAHGTYQSWRTDTIGEAFDVDGSYGCQCWDYASLFWWNVGFPSSPLYPKTGPQGYASEVWTVSRFQNVAYNGTTYFRLINNLMEVKEGDVIVFSGIPGHIAFADEDYTPGAFFIRCVGQNQGGGTPQPGGGTTVSVNNLQTSGFLGAFRYIPWETTPPTPTVQSKPKQKHFPWVLYARKFRDGRR